VKYVMFKLEDGRELPVVFPKEMVHSLVAGAVVHMLRRHHKVTATPVSAGDCSFHAFSCTGESTTLRLKAREDDRDEINQIDYSNGMPFEAAD